MFDFVVISSKDPLPDYEIAQLTNSQRNLRASFVYQQCTYHISADKRRAIICCSHKLSDNVAIRERERERERVCAIRWHGFSQW
jgi:hypothetical protein